MSDMDRLASDVAKEMTAADRSLGRGNLMTSTAHSLKATNGILLGLLDTQRKLLGARQTFYGTEGDA